MNFEVEFFELDNGKCPVIDFLNSLNTKIRAKTVKMISLSKDDLFIRAKRYRAENAVFKNAF